MTIETYKTSTASKTLAGAIDNSRSLFRALLKRHVSSDGASMEQYKRYLTMQFHLTREVQTYFIAAAGHRDLARRRHLRKFLIEFANEEELHYLVAANDLAALGLEVGPMPFDVVLWHSYFKSIVSQRPFVRLGAACILENISGGEAREETNRALKAPFLNRANSKFLVLHQHETLPHGDQILDALDRADLSEAHLSDLAFGASAGTVIYLRMAEWALDTACLSSMADVGCDIDETELSKIDAVSIDERMAVTIG
jgi:hypothetical protein